MDKKDIAGFNPVKFIELLLKLDGRAKGQKVGVLENKRYTRKKVYRYRSGTRQYGQEIKIYRSFQFGEKPIWKAGFIVEKI